MILVDTHSHIYEKDFDEDIAAVVARMREQSVLHAFLPNIDLESVDRMLALKNAFPSYFSIMMGLHPTSVNADYKSVLEQLYRNFDKCDFCGIGEIGLDFYWDKSFVTEQIDAFETQVGWAVEKGLPLSIHSRKATPEIIHSLKKFQKSKLKGVFHSFSGSKETANELFLLGDFYFGINGVVTFKNAGVAQVVEQIPLDRIVLETDAPYLTPVPFRGKRNESAYIKIIAEKIAEIKGISLDEVADVTTKNAANLWNCSEDLFV
jgi:TatD DNase family protein